MGNLKTFLSMLVEIHACWLNDKLFSIPASCYKIVLGNF